MANCVRGEVEDTGSQTKKTSSSVSEEFITGDEFSGDGHNGRDAKSQIPAGSGDDHCLKELRAFLFNPADDENAKEATNYLCCIGWKQDEDKRCFTSPGNIKYDSLAKVCEYLIQGSSSSHSESRALVLHEKEREKVSCPQVVADWYILASTDKRKAPRTLSSQVKQYLLTAGWKLQYISKNITKNKTKRELRYISPKGHTHISLVRACKEIMDETTGNNTSHRPSTASHGMQSQVHNQGKSQISLQSQSQPRQQLSSQNLQNTIVNAGVRSSASLLPALPSMTSLTQTSMPNSAGQRINMQSGIAQNFVGSSVSQGVPSMIFSKKQLQHQISKQKLHGNIQSSVRQSHIQPQSLQQPQNLLQPTQMSNAVGRSTNMPHQILSSSMDSEAHTEHNAVDWQEEIYLKIQFMKEKYFVELSDMYHKINMKCKQHNDSDLNVPESELIEELKTWKIKLDGIIHPFYVSKKQIVPGMMEKYLADLNQICYEVSTTCKQHNHSVLNVPKSKQSEELKSWKILLKHMTSSFYGLQK